MASTTPKLPLDGAAPAAGGAAPGGTGDADGAVSLEGTLARITYRDADSHFTIGRLIAASGAAHTVVGELFGITEGMPLTVRGTWVDDRKYGRQFRITTYQLKTPATVLGIEKFLGSGVVSGVGPALAGRIVEKFGMQTLDVIAQEPARLTEVIGIGAARAGKIHAALAAHRGVADVMVFLQGHGVSPAFAARIVKQYGASAMNVVRENPYRLSREIWGIGFRTADNIARKLGIAADAPERFEAGVLHVLDTQLGDGHLYVEDARLRELTIELLAIFVKPDQLDLVDPVTRAVTALERAGYVTREVLGDRGACIAMTQARDAEVRIAQRLGELIRTPAKAYALDVHAAVDLWQQQRGIALAPEQKQAVIAALLDKCVVITGGPGVGKTTIVRALVEIAERARRVILLAAPTGRAGMRLAEATARGAVTLHRLLEYQPQNGGFQRNQRNPLEADLVIVDEASMIDVYLAQALIDALPQHCQLVMVGDVDQLPAVGPGAILADLIDSNTVTVVRLTEVFRQAAASRIVTAAHAINRGELPDLATIDGSDFYFIERTDPASAREAVVEVVAERIPKRFGFDPIDDVQVLTPMHRGELGTLALNEALQARLNPAGGAEVRRGDRVYRIGDKVMQLRNDYDRGVWNGDIGRIVAIDTDASTVTMALPDGRSVVYERAELDQLVHGYAASVHKSQGSEYPAVVLVLATQHFMMLQRSLLYTAVTRGKQLVVIVGSKRALATAAQSARQQKRLTWLAERLRSEQEAHQRAESAGPDDADDDGAA